MHKRTEESPQAPATGVLPLAKPEEKNKVISEGSPDSHRPTFLDPLLVKERTDEGNEQPSLSPPNNLPLNFVPGLS